MSHNYVLTTEGSAFPWRRCGFSSAVAMLEGMPDVVRFQYSPKDGDYRLYGKGTKDMYMPSWVVKAQGKGERVGQGVWFGVGGGGHIGLAIQWNLC